MFLMSKLILKKRVSRYFSHRGVFNVIPAKAGIQSPQLITYWIPAFAGMTGVYRRNSPTLEIFTC